MQQFVDRDASLEDAPAVAERLLSWLIDNGVLDPALRTSDEFARAASEKGIVVDPGVAAMTGWSAGPRYAEWVERTNEDVRHPQVDDWLTFEVGRNLFFAGNDSNLGTCPSGHTVELDDLGDALSAWHEGEEPVLRCEPCGGDHPLTEWDLDGFAVGRLAIDVRDWDPLSDQLLAELRRIVAPHRTAYLTGKI